MRESQAFFFARNSFHNASLIGQEIETEDDNDGNSETGGVSYKAGMTVNGKILKPMGCRRHCEWYDEGFMTVDGIDKDG